MHIYHSTDEVNWAPHVGACFTPCDRANYGDTRITVAADFAGLVVRRVLATASEMRASLDNNEWAGDYDLDAYRAAGVDVIRYDDCDQYGRAHETYRVVSCKAVDCITIVSVDGGDDDDDDA
jgi:hypothetical protein